MSFENPNNQYPDQEMIGSDKEKIEELRAIHRAKAEIALQTGEAGQLLDKTAQYSDKIQQKYPDFNNYKLYHVALGSTVKDEYSKFDFPGDDSAEKFIRETL